MKLKVLVDNNTYIDHYYYGEPALSYYIEDGDKKILFDAGYSDIFIKNAEAFGIDFNEISDIVFSHGHDDHSRGLKYLFEQFKIPHVRVTAHPNAFNEKVVDGKPYGCPLNEKQVREHANLFLSNEPVKISDNIFFLGEVPASNDFEKRKQFGQERRNGVFVDDFVLDDSAIVYKGERGLFVITGCSHSGICNIIEYSKKVCNEDRITGVIGGFHLFDVDMQLEKTIEYFIKNNIRKLYPCHCVSFKVKAEIHKYIPVHEVGVGMELDL